MEKFGNDQRECVLDEIFYGKPVQVVECVGDVLAELGVSENPGSRVLDVLESIQEFV